MESLIHWIDRIFRLFPVERTRLHEILKRWGGRKRGRCERKLSEDAATASLKNAASERAAAIFRRLRKIDRGSSNTFPAFSLPRSKISWKLRKFLLLENLEKIGYLDLVMGVDDFLKDKRKAILNIATRHGAYNVHVFGSIARGSAHPQSDVDLLVEFEPDRSLLDQSRLVQDLEDLLGRRVDVVEPKGLHWYIRDQILKEAVPL